MELEEAIKILKEDLEHTKKANECGLATKGEFNKEIEAIETVLNELDAIKFKYQARKDRTDTIIKKQEKMIELMLDWINNNNLYEDEYGNNCLIEGDSCYEWKYGNKNCKECIKQYFEKKAEESE